MRFNEVLQQLNRCMDVGETILNLNESVGNSKDVYVIVPISVISLKGPTSILGQSIVVTNSSSGKCSPYNLNKRNIGVIRNMRVLKIGKFEKWDN